MPYISAISILIMLLHESLPWADSQKDPRLHCGESYPLKITLLATCSTYTKTFYLLVLGHFKLYNLYCFYLNIFFFMRDTRFTPYSLHDMVHLIKCFSVSSVSVSQVTDLHAVSFTLLKMLKRACSGRKTTNTSCMLRKTNADL